MKLFLSCDIEGTCGITHWDETEPGKGVWYDYFRRQMTAEAVAACEGAFEAGVTGIRVKDAHDSARNLLPEALPAGVELSRGWSGGLYSMVDGIEDGSFAAAAFTGWHSPAFGAGNPLSHTLSLGVDEITLNGQRASEFCVFTYAAALAKVPVIFVSGDAALCEEAEILVPGLVTVPVNRGKGDAVVSIHPQKALELIKSGVKEAVLRLKNEKTPQVPHIPPSFDVKIRFRKHQDAFKASFYPGAKQVNEKTISFSAQDYLDVLRFFRFVVP